MPAAQTLRDKLEYLTQATGRPESAIVAQAVEEGLAELYRKQVAETYLSGHLDRAQAIAELGEDAIEDLDAARRAVEHDVKWGLQGG